jgi:L-threonylcarbamoyladenylate synthase
MQRPGALRDKPRIWRMDAGRPDAAIIRAAADCIRNGCLVIFPTRCLYGLAADALNAAAVDRVFAAKNRPASNPVSILIPRKELLADFVREVPGSARKVMAHFWPGAIPLIFHAAPGLPANLTAKTGTIGIRLPAHPVAEALAAAAGRPITATSANVSSEPGSRQVSKVSARVADAADMILDAGKLDEGIGSTILDVTCDPPKILREGAVAALRLRQVVPALVSKNDSQMK